MVLIYDLIIDTEKRAFFLCLGPQSLDAFLDRYSRVLAHRGVAGCDKLWPKDSVVSLHTH